jgi:flagellar protein FliS
MRQAAHAYRRVNIESASPTRILDELYGRLLRDCAEAKQAISVGDIAGKQAAIDHALRIVGELASSLERDAAPELCDNLVALYDFAQARLLEGSRNMTREPIEDAAHVVAELRGAFAQAGAAVMSAEAAA